ncbi:MAG TPA: DUF1810 domain-containing protein [Ramlibacter sp.]|nr:DUF1810 domain-containing protein [Ramlibacter sp.]
MDADPFDLQRFVDAQSRVMDDVEHELAQGRKRTHWMWFVFPQLAALGRSATARHFGLSSLAEAQAYLQHPVLGERLRHCCRLLLQIDSNDPNAVFGSPDDLKLRSCLTLFSLAAPTDPLFAQCLRKFYGGLSDEQTQALCA